MGQRLSFSALFQFFYSYPLRPPGGEEKKTRRRGQPGGASSIFPLGLIPSVIIPCALRAGQARGLLWETCGFPPEAPPCNLPRNPPSLSESNVSPSARRPRVPTKASLSEHSDLSARDRMEGHAQAPRHADTLPAVRPGQGFGGSQVVPAPRQSLRRRDGVRTKGELPCPDFMPPRIRGWTHAPACPENEAFVGTGGQRTQSLSARYGG